MNPQSKLNFATPRRRNVSFATKGTTKEQDNHRQLLASCRYVFKVTHQLSWRYDARACGFLRDTAMILRSKPTARYASQALNREQY